MSRARRSQSARDATAARVPAVPNCAKCGKASTKSLQVEWCSRTNQWCRDCCLKSFGSAIFDRCPRHFCLLTARVQAQVQAQELQPDPDSDEEDVDDPDVAPDGNNSGSELHGVEDSSSNAASMQRHERSNVELHRQGAHGVAPDIQAALAQRMNARQVSHHTRTASSNLDTAAYVDATGFTLPYDSALDPKAIIDRRVQHAVRQLKKFTSIGELREALDAALMELCNQPTTRPIDVWAINRIHTDILFTAQLDLEFGSAYLVCFNQLMKSREGLLPVECYDGELPGRDIMAFSFAQRKLGLHRPFAQASAAPRLSTATPRRQKRGQKHVRASAPGEEPRTATSGEATSTKSCDYHPGATSHSTAECHRAKRTRRPGEKESSV